MTKNLHVDIIWVSKVVRQCTKILRFVDGSEVFTEVTVDWVVDGIFVVVFGAVVVDVVVVVVAFVVEGFAVAGAGVCTWKM